MRTHITTRGDMADAIAFGSYGDEHGGTAEAVLAANPGLADYGPLLPENLTVMLPDLAPAPRRIVTIDLWAAT